MDLLSVNDQLDASNDEVSSLKKQLVRAQDEIKSVRDRSDKEISAKNDEFEEFKWIGFSFKSYLTHLWSWRRNKMYIWRRKMNLKYSEVQDQLVDALAKLNSSEKIKHNLQEQIDFLVVDLDKVYFGWDCGFKKAILWEFFLKRLSATRKMLSDIKGNWKATMTIWKALLPIRMLN
jgi:hypothetical protein